MGLWPHQARAVEQARDRYREGSRAICVVAPTGAGKTRIGVEIATGAARKGGDVLWLAHRRELVAQARCKLPPGIRVETIQGLAASGERPPASVVVFDEAHHYVADQWGRVAGEYADALRVGLTATPERSDGRALGDMFSSLVVAASYSELIAGAYLVDCDVYAPDRRGSTLAMPAAEALRRWGRKRQGVVFCDTVGSAADGAADSWGAVVTAATPTRDRDLSIGGFRDGAIRALWNVYVLTEGFDAPQASLCILARGASHPSTYLQMVGRVLRSAPGKGNAVVIDLCGAVHEHGHPTEDRTYSLEGRAIGRDKADPIWQCKVCGWCTTRPPVDRRCPSCGEMLPEPEAIRVQRRRVARQERDKKSTPQQREAAYAALKRLGEERGYKPGWARMIYQSRYGHWPKG